MEQPGRDGLKASPRCSEGAGQPPVRDGAWDNLLLHLGLRVVSDAQEESIYTG